MPRGRVPAARVGAGAQVAQQRGADPAQFDGAAGAALFAATPACNSAVSATGRVLGTTWVKFCREDGEARVRREHVAPRLVGRGRGACQARGYQRHGHLVGPGERLRRGDRRLAFGGPAQLAQHDGAIAAYLDQADQRRLRGGIDRSAAGLAAPRSVARRPTPGCTPPSPWRPAGFRAAPGPRSLSPPRPAGPVPVRRAPGSARAAPGSACRRATAALSLARGASASAWRNNVSASAKRPWSETCSARCISAVTVSGLSRPSALCCRAKRGTVRGLRGGEVLGEVGARAQRHQSLVFADIAGAECVRRQLLREQRVGGRLRQRDGRCADPTGQHADRALDHWERRQDAVGLVETAAHRGDQRHLRPAADPPPALHHGGRLVAEDRCGDRCVADEAEIDGVAPRAGGGDAHRCRVGGRRRRYGCAPRAAATCRRTPRRVSGASPGN